MKWIRHWTYRQNKLYLFFGVLGVLSLHLNMRIFLSYLHTGGLEVCIRTSFVHFLKMMIPGPFQFFSDKRPAQKVKVSVGITHNYTLDIYCKTIFRACMLLRNNFLIKINTCNPKYITTRSICNLKSEKLSAPGICGRQHLDHMISHQFCTNWGPNRSRQNGYRFVGHNSGPSKISRTLKLKSKTSFSDITTLWILKVNPHYIQFSVASFNLKCFEYIILGDFLFEIYIYLLER